MSPPRKSSARPTIGARSTSKQRYCLADLVALGRPDKLSSLYPEQHTIPEDGLGFSAENWCVMPKLGNQLYLAIDAGPIHDEARQADRGGRNLARHDRSEARGNGLENPGGKRRADGPRQPAILRSDPGHGVVAARRTKKPLSLLFADVDCFKAYNDLHGHQKGDECLRAVAAVIGENALRPADLSARYGGEEFATIMPETDTDGARKVAERLRVVLAGMQMLHGASGVGPFGDAQHRHRNPGPQRRRRRLGRAAGTGRPGAVCSKTFGAKPRGLRRRRSCSIRPGCRPRRAVSGSHCRGQDGNSAAIAQVDEPPLIAPCCSIEAQPERAVPAAHARVGFCPANFSKISLSPGI